jgi:AP-1 complex subunit mu
VRLSRFENDRTISFIPPDGEFELMSYRINTQVKPLIWAEAMVELHSNSRVEYMVKAKAQFKRRSTANNVEIYVPVPDDADSPRFRASVGTVHYVPEKSAFVWKIKQLGGGREYLMRAQFGLPSVRSGQCFLLPLLYSTLILLYAKLTGGLHSSASEDVIEKRPPITIKFEIPYFTVSGIQVRYLKIVEKSGYQALPWVRCVFFFLLLLFPQRLTNLPGRLLTRMICASSPPQLHHPTWRRLFIANVGAHSLVVSTRVRFVRA